MTSGPPGPRADPLLALRAARELGPPALARFLIYRAGLHSGWIARRTAPFDWDERPLAGWLRPGVPSDPSAYAAYRARAQAPRFFFPPGDSPPLAPDRTLAEAEEILAGRFRLFGGPPRPLGFPPDWHAYAPLEGRPRRAPPPSDLHWAAYDFDELPEDVKLIWEPSRFAWIYPLAGAYRLTGQARYAEGLLDLIDSWRRANPPQRGLNWASGQEAALRVLALSYALHALAPALSAQPARLAGMVQSLAVNAARIPPTLIYARALANNHLISEAAGLFTAGLLFPELRAAPAWLRLGRRTLVQGLIGQIGPDGGHCQHSVNYLRMVLQAGLWCARLGEVNGRPLAPAALGALQRAAALLHALTDPQTGQAPNLGPNDGGQAFWLSARPFDDQRPTLQLAAALVGAPPLPAGEWDDLCACLGLSPPHAAPAPAPLDFPSAGVYWLRGGEARAALRCARFRSRPGHSDQLHLDLWRRGRNWARDPGSYLYNAAPPWEHALAEARFHNTLRVDGREPMRRAGRFLWLDWAQAEWLGRWRSLDGVLELVLAQHRGYRRLGVVHRRAVVRAGSDRWLVVDELIGRGPARAQLTWHLPDHPTPALDALRLSLPDADGGLELSVAAHTPAAPQLALYRAGELAAGAQLAEASPAWGWHAPTYAARTPALTLAVEAGGPLPLRLLTGFNFGAPPAVELVLVWAEPGAAAGPLHSIEYDRRVLTPSTPGGA